MITMIIKHNEPSVNIAIRYMPGSLKKRIYREAGRRQAGGDLGFDRGGINAGQIISELSARELGLILEKPPEKKVPQMVTRRGAIGFTLILPKELFDKLNEDDLRAGSVRNLSKNEYILNILTDKDTHWPEAYKLIREDKTASYALTLPVDLRLQLFKEAGIRMLAGEIGPDGGPVTVSRLIQEKLAASWGMKLPPLPVLDDNSEEEILVRMKLSLKEAVRKASSEKGQSMNRWFLDVLDRNLPKISNN